MTPPICQPECQYYNYAIQLEALGAILTDVIKQRDSLLLQVQELLPQC